MSKKLVIVGAGPVGLEAAVRAIHDGFEVTVLERGEVGQAIHRWGHVSLFSPFEMNSSQRSRDILAKEKSVRLPDRDAILTGAEFCQRWLQPLAASHVLASRVLTRHRVVAVGRQALSRGDLIGRPQRGAAPFRILCQVEQGTGTGHDDCQEVVFHADIVLDCTGFTGRHGPVGTGGIPCPGESRNLREENYQIPDIMSADRTNFANRHTLVVGSGYSAATSVQLLSGLVDEFPKTRITWLTRGGRAAPIAEIADDPLTERRRLTENVNQLALHAPFVHWISGAMVEQVARTAGQYSIALSGDPNHRPDIPSQLQVDRILVHTGFRPDVRPFEELQIHRCFATDGPIKLAAHLLGEASADCLQQSAGGPELLMNPEPNFYVLGAASYGRNSRFLLRSGIAQVNQLFDQLAERRGQP